MSSGTKRERGGGTKREKHKEKESIVMFEFLIRCKYSDALNSHFNCLAIFEKTNELSHKINLN